MSDIMIVSAARTPVGTFNGAFDYDAKRNGFRQSGFARLFQAL